MQHYGERKTPARPEQLYREATEAELNMNYGHSDPKVRLIQAVPVKHDYKAGAEEIDRLTYVQLADIGYQTAARRIVKAVLGIGRDSTP